MNQNDLIDISPRMTSSNSPKPFMAYTNSKWHNNDYDAWKLFDGVVDSYNYWCSASRITKCHCVLDFGKPTMISHVSFFPYPASGNNYNMPKDFNICGSNDGINFIIIKEFKNIIKWENGVYSCFPLDGKFIYRYYKLDILSCNSPDYVCINEMKFLLAKKRYLIKSNDDKYKYINEENNLVELNDNSLNNYNNYGMVNLDIINNKLDTILDFTISKIQF